MGAKVTFKITTQKDDKFTCPDDGVVTSSNISQFKPPFSEGQLIFVEDIAKIYLDFHDKRLCYTPDIPVYNGLNYLGIAQEKPTKNGVILEGHSVTIIPRINDMVVYKTKEYLYRNGNNGEDWYEIGDEDSPEWN